uniref:Uncharacterized protein n=1 Tax=Amphimedon queenslandica TaxID=400682 RepID=A0A1X7TC97_AMPQE
MAMASVFKYSNISLFVSALIAVPVVYMTSYVSDVVKEQAVKGKKFKKPKKRPKRLHVVQPSNKASKKQATEVDTSSSSSDYKDMEIVKIGKKAPPAKKKDDSSSSSDKTDIEDTTPSKLVAKPTNDAKKCDLSDNSSSDDDSEETKEPAKASTKRKQEESESDDDCSDESETHNVPLTKKMKKGGLGSIGGHSMSKASEPELLSNLRAIHETIRSLDEQIKLVSEKISCYQDIRKSCWTSYTETNVPETTSWELSIVWELDNVIIPSLKNHESMMMKLELEKCALQSLYKGFVFRVLSDDNNKK